MIILIYIPIFKTGLVEALLKLLSLFNNIIKVEKLTMGPQIYAMTKNLLEGQFLQVIEQKYHSYGNETMINYKLVIEGLTTHLFPRNSLQLQKRYLQWVLFKPQESNNFSVSPMRLWTILKTSIPLDRNRFYMKTRSFI